MLKTLKAEVAQMLKIYPETRDSDISLMIMLWQNYHKSQLVSMNNGTIYVALKSLYDLPREDNIKRIRAKFQNELGLYLPTKLEVALRRGIEEAKWRSFMGYAPVDPNRYVEPAPTQPVKIAEKVPNILGQCPACRGGLYKMRVSGKDQIQCLKCNKIL